MKSGQITVTHEGLTSHYVRVHWSLVGISGLVATIVVTLVLFSSVPSATWSPLEGMKESTKSKIQQTVPQGWAFFTRSAREPLTVPFNTQGYSLSKLPTAGKNNLFGLNREGRSQGLEIGAVLNSAGQDNFQDCASPTVQDCISSAKKTEPNPISVQNIVTYPSLCGELFLLSVVPAPYEYRNLLNEHLVAEKWLFMDVKC